MRSFSAWALAALLLGAGPAASTTLETVETRCPVDGRRFSAFRVTETNNLGGQDRDLCPHALGQQPATVVVWVCPGCGFAGPEADFALRLNEEQRASLRQRVGAPRLAGATEDQRLYEPADKYRNALACAEILGRSAKERGDLAFLGAWACRLTRTWSSQEEGEYDGLSDLLGLAEQSHALAPQYRPLKEAQLIVTAVRAGRLPEARRAEALYFAATLYRSRGEHPWAEPLFAEAGRLTDEASLHERIARETALMEAERGFQKQALELYVRALAAGEVPDALRAELLYRMGETHRRLGDKEQAVRFYQQALSADGLSAELSAWAREQLQSVQR